MNSIVKRILYYVRVRFSSPVSISGDQENTDGDVFRDYDGAALIPGSSLAGAFRGYLRQSNTEDGIFGFSGDEERQGGRMSRLFLSDLTFTNEIKIVIRDGVGLSRNKTAITGAKYDLEAIDRGAEAQFIMELVIRESDDEETLIRQLYEIIYGLHAKEVRLGCKKNRGYGEMEVCSIHRKEYTKDNLLEYRNAYLMNEKEWKELPDVKEKFLDRSYRENQYMNLEIPLRLRGPISIRQYGTKKGEPDFVHITAGGEPVIPGTSFAGAIRSRMREMLELLFPDRPQENLELVLGKLFGYVNGDQASQSSILIDESVIQGAIPVTTMRTAISRLESSVRMRSLYKERTYADGTTMLKIHVSKNRNVDPELAVGLLLPVLKDLQNGYLSVGGQTAIGRGIFEPNGSIRIDGEAVDEMRFCSMREKLEEVMA